MDAIERAAGRVLIVGIPARALIPPLDRWAREAALGGIILFRRNLGSLEESAATIRGLYEGWDERAPLIAIDQEGGRVARLEAPIVRLPAMRTLGTIDDPELTRRCGRVLGAQLRALGIGLDFAPVLDIDTNPANPVIGDRAFGRDAATVIRHGLALADGLSDAGIVACGKHFPGHGDTDLDSHLALPKIAHGRDRLETVELAPFRAARARIPTIMTAHVVFESLDPGIPATLSEKVISGLLRRELGYDGVIVSDDLEMKAVADRWGSARAGVRAIAAGCDALLVCASLERIIDVRDALLARARSDDAFRSRLLDAASRVDSLPRVAPPTDPRPTIAAAGGPELEREIAERAARPLMR